MAPLRQGAGTKPDEATGRTGNRTSVCLGIVISVPGSIEQPVGAILRSGESEQVGWMLIASSITFLIGAFIFNGVIIGIITNSIERRVANHQEGHIHYLKSGHYIIMGYDEMVPSFISYIFEKDKNAYVLIMTSAEVADIREKLHKSFTEEQMRHIIINYGHRISTEDFKDIYLETSADTWKTRG